MELPVFERVLTQEEVIEAVTQQKTMQSSQICWFGVSLPSPFFQYFLLQDSSNLWFGATIPFPTQSQKEYEKLVFQEGLWEKDVAELFLLDPSSGRYMEFNFSPIHAWWCCEFQNYRQPKALGDVPQINFIEYRIEESSWSVLVAIDRAALPFPLSNSTLVHISSIVPQTPPIYLTSNTKRIVSFDPDFHRFESFLPLHIVLADSL